MKPSLPEGIRKKMESLKTNSQFYFHVNAVKNKHEPNLVRALFWMKGKDDRFVNDCILLQYYILSGEEEVHSQVNSHGNAVKHNRPFYPSATSLKKELKERTTNGKGTSTNLCGEITSRQSSSDNHNPANVQKVQRIYNVNRCKKRVCDPVNDLLLYTKHCDQNIVPNTIQSNIGLGEYSTNTRFRTRFT